MVPLSLYAKIKTNLEIKNRKVIKKCKNEGYFIYSNHTQEIIDTVLPTIVSFPKRVYVLAHPNNVSIKGMKTINKMLGALPIPGDLESSKKFLEAIRLRIKNKNVISIYPEAHVWPYYTRIRNFKSVSFKYPVELDAPSFACTSTYKKVKCRKKPTLVVYVDGPFYPNKTLPIKEAQEELRNQIYEVMKKRSLNSDMEYIKYVKLKDDNKIIKEKIIK